MPTQTVAAPVFAPSGYNVAAGVCGILGGGFASLTRSHMTVSLFGADPDTITAVITGALSGVLVLGGGVQPVGDEKKRRRRKRGGKGRRNRQANASESQNGQVAQGDAVDLEPHEPRRRLLTQDSDEEMMDEDEGEVE